jgi:hypothetical protein
MRSTNDRETGRGRRKMKRMGMVVAGKTKVREWILWTSPRIRMTCVARRVGVF